MRYLITFACYGNCLHGDEVGSVDREHNVPGSRLVQADAERADEERKAMTHAPYLLDSVMRSEVLSAIREVCKYRKWSLLAAHVRTNHVHVIVEADVKPERIMNDFKSYASRHLNQLAHNEKNRKRWAHHGSTKWLWSDREVQKAVEYVVDRQGEPMALFVSEGL